MCTSGTLEPNEMKAFHSLSPVSVCVCARYALCLLVCETVTNNFDCILFSSSHGDISIFILLLRFVFVHGIDLLVASGIVRVGECWRDEWNVLAFICVGENVWHTKNVSNIPQIQWSENTSHKQSIFRMCTKHKFCTYLTSGKLEYWSRHTIVCAAEVRRSTSLAKDLKLTKLRSQCGFYGVCLVSTEQWTRHAELYSIPRTTKMCRINH